MRDNNSVFVPCCSTPEVRLVNVISTFCKEPFIFPRERRTVQRERNTSPVKATKSTSEYPSAVPRRRMERLSFCAIPLSATSMTETLFSFALFIRGVQSNKARHKASSKVDFPAPVLPVMANIPAEHKGSTVKSIINSPSNEARFFPLIATIFILPPP